MGVRVISTTGRIANRTKEAINLFCSEGEGNWWNEASPGQGEREEGSCSYIYYRSRAEKLVSHGLVQK